MKAQMNEKAEDLAVTDNAIDQESVRMWTVFTDPKINSLLEKAI